MTVRTEYLLRVCKTLLEKQEETPYAIDLLGTDIYYDGVMCDGMALLNDIRELLGEGEE